MNKLIPLLLIVLLFSTIPAYASKILAVDPDNQRTNNPLVIRDPQTSQFTLEHVSRLGENHFYTFKGFAGEEIFMQVMVPDLDGFRDFKPSFDLLYGEQKITAVPTVLRFHESYSDTHWIVRAELKTTLQNDGTYLVRVHDELEHYEFGNVGKFGFVIGEDKNFTIFDVLAMPIWIIQIKIFFNEIQTVVSWIILIFLLVFSIMFAVWYMEMD